MTPEPGTLSGTPPADERLARPRPGDELELQIDSLAFGGEGVARLGRGGLCRVRRRRDSGGSRARDGLQAQAHLRARPRDRGAASRAPSGSRRRPTIPACPGRCCPTSASWRSSAGRSTRRCGGSGGWTGSSWRRSCRRSSSGAIATSSSTRSAMSEDGELRVRLSRSGGWQAGRADRGLPAGLRAGQPRARAGAALVSRAGPHRLGARRPGRSRTRGGRARARTRRAPRAHRAGGTRSDGRARLRNLVVREGRRTGKLQVRLVSTDGELDASALALALSDALGESV